MENKILLKESKSDPVIFNSPNPSPELLMPVGSLEKMHYALAYGADAIYAGVPYFSLRARENDFQMEHLKTAIEKVHTLNKKIYVTANIFARNMKIPRFKEEIKTWMSFNPDAFIMSDPGLMLVMRESFPEANIHLSVQANCMNWQTVKFWKQSLGVQRIILSRELNINEVREIKQRVPEIELEAFVHGAICIAYSGRCLLSSYFSHRDANQGVCDNSCREKYHIYGKKNVPEESMPREKDEFYIEDLRNQDQFYRIDEDDHGTYIMNAKDLCLIQHLKSIYDAGVCSFKVEGRTKSIYYLALVARAYRKAIDDLMSNKDFDKELLKELSKVAHRGYSTGFMVHENPGREEQNYQTSQSRSFTQKYVGLLTKDTKSSNGVITTIPDGFHGIEVKGTLRKGQICEILGPGMQSYSFQATQFLDHKLRPKDSIHSGAGLHFIETKGPFIENGIVSVIG